MIEGTGPSNQDKGRHAVGVDGATVASGVETPFPRRPSDELSSESLRADTGSSGAPVADEPSTTSDTATGSLPRSGSRLAETLDRKHHEVLAEEARQASDRAKFGLSPRASRAAVDDMIELVGKLQKDCRTMFDSMEDSASFVRSPDGSFSVLLGRYFLEDETIPQLKNTIVPVREWNLIAEANVGAIAVVIAGLAGACATYQSLLATVGVEWMKATLGIHPIMAAVPVGYLCGALASVNVMDGLTWVESAVQRSLFKNFLGRALRVKEPGSLGGVLGEIHANEGFRGEISICDGSSIYLTVTYTPKADA